MDVVHLYRETDQTPVWVNPNKIELFPHSCPLSKAILVPQCALLFYVETG